MTHEKLYTVPTKKNYLGILGSGFNLGNGYYYSGSLQAKIATKNGK
jgi:hypothetical protein